jgi:hypothetical protein
MGVNEFKAILTSFSHDFYPVARLGTFGLDCRRGAAEYALESGPRNKCSRKTECERCEHVKDRMLIITSAVLDVQVT